MTISLKKLILVLQSIFLTLVINMDLIQVVSPVMGFDRYSRLFFSNCIYFLYIVFVFLYYLLTREAIRIKNYIIISILIALLLYSLLSALVSSEISRYLKFLVCIFLGVSTVFVRKDVLKKSISFSLILNAIYAIFINMNYNKINSMMWGNKDFNYITVTLTLGLCLSYLSFLILYSNKKKDKIIFLLLIFLYCSTILKFNARGNLIFPIIIFVLACLKKSQKDIINLFKMMIVIIILCLISYYIIINVFSEQQLERLISILNFTSEEPRYILYKEYISYILEDFNWILGTGFATSERILNSLGLISSYPHNYLLELLGDLGVIGFFIGSYFTLYIVKRTIILFNRLNSYPSTQASLIGAYIGGLIFFIFSYLKSYSIFDGYPLFMMMAIIYKIYITTSVSFNYKEKYL